MLTISAVLFLTHWGGIGVGIIQNLYNFFLKPIIRGLQNLHPPVQIWVLPFLHKTLLWPLGRVSVCVWYWRLIIP
jgi:hypothetical protein